MSSSGGTVTVRDPGSWRDPSGFVFRRDGAIHRQIAPSFQADWEAYLKSGLHERLVAAGAVLPFEDVPLEAALDPATAWRVIRPEQLDLISYPYEWSFGQLKDAALLTLDVQLKALDAGLTLRDASAYNIQFRGPKPVLIDSLSFERYVEGTPWVAYRQFCEHFLAPLALMSIRDVRLGRMLRSWVDGIPIDLAAGLLPGRTKARFGLLAHLHLHGRAQRKGTPSDGAAAKQVRVPKERQVALIGNLRKTVEGLRWSPGGTEWADYADNTSYSDTATAAKARLVESLLRDAGGDVVWDLGANTGRYSAIAAGLGRRVVSWDIDPAAVERHHLALKQSGETRITPLVIDLADPSPAQGWALEERASLVGRSNADVLLGLALVHHLAIGRNVPLPMVAAFFGELADDAVIEWVPREDPMVQTLLAGRKDIFDGYHEDGFRAAFESTGWQVCAREPIEASPRVLYRFSRRA
ncbi:MAG: SAM-dependent methyltransferase [Chloroflexota bacterium]